MAGLSSPLGNSSNFLTTKEIEIILWISVSSYSPYPKEK